MKQEAISYAEKGRVLEMKHRFGKGILKIEQWERQMTKDTQKD